MDEDFLEGDLRHPDDLRQLLRNLAYDEILLVAAISYADIDLPDGDAVWRFELVAPDRLVISRAALRVLSKCMEVLSLGRVSRSSDFHQPHGGRASPYSGRESAAQPADFAEVPRGKATEAFNRVGSIPTWQLGPVMVGDFPLPPCVMKSA